MIVATLISILNFLVTSEIATKTHLKKNLLKAELSSMNPLMLLQNRQLLKAKGIFFETLGQGKMGEVATDVVIALPGRRGERMSLILAKEMHVDGREFSSDLMTIFTPREKSGKVALENVRKTRSESENISKIIDRKAASFSDDHLSLKYLLLKLRETENPQGKSKALSEIFRRFSLGLAPLTFTLMGLSFGLSISRRDSRKGLIYATLLATLFLTTFFLAKGSSQKAVLSWCLYFIPHLLILGFSLAYLKNISRGIE